MILRARLRAGCADTQHRNGKGHFACLREIQRYGDRRALRERLLQTVEHEMVTGRRKAHASPRRQVHASHHLVAGAPGKPFSGPFYGVEKDGPSYFPYPTIAWDYINRAMPASNPGSLKPNEVYALVAYLYYRNGIIKENDVMDEKTLPKVVMPNRNGFVPAKPVYPPEKKPSWY